ncbi:MAG: TIGR02391 family protein [Saprospiraceae bacterium]|nr:TIGR02391 family protein [Saprospiraceae bacterium]
MANLTTLEIQILEKTFQMSGGYVINFTDRIFKEFFQDDIGIDIYDSKYDYGSGSKANRIRGFWYKADDKIVGVSILKLVDYIENQINLGVLEKAHFPNEILSKAKEIGEKLTDYKIKIESQSQASFIDGNITIKLQKEIFDHVQNLINDGHYFNAIEESYKIVRQKLKDITGKERAHEAFKESNYENIFGRQPKDEVERDFFEGVKFLHMSIQYLRNEKAHTPAVNLDKNLAIHYISLASLAFDLINRN